MARMNLRGFIGSRRRHPLSVTMGDAERRRWISIAALSVACGVFVAYFLWLQLRRYEQLGAYAFDLGIFQQAVWLMAHGETPFVTVRGMNILGDHFTPILYLLAIPYRFWAHPFWLFLAQTVALAAGVLPLYRMALRHTGKEWAATAIAIGYLLQVRVGCLRRRRFQGAYKAVLSARKEGCQLRREGLHRCLCDCL